MRAIVLAACLVVALATPADAYRCNSRHYFNSSGRLVHSPSCGRHKARKMAICYDGSRSYSRHHRGTCSRHGGVRRWF
ncbi:MAG: DUF3761 domain-containing protein [Hyphomicrobiales bacterium]|nr:DUF3761 domain-containing protein [Hyphomicrobiales bacterium]